MTQKFLKHYHDQFINVKLMSCLRAAFSTGSPRYQVMVVCDGTTDQIVDEVGEGPDHRYADKGNAEQDDVQEADAQDVREPHSPAVHYSGVGVHLAMRRAHVHYGGRRFHFEAATYNNNTRTQRDPAARR